MDTYCAICEETIAPGDDRGHCHGCGADICLDCYEYKEIKACDAACAWRAEREATADAYYERSLGL